MLVYCHFDSWKQVLVKFELEFYHFHSRKCIWKYQQPKWWPFCPGGDELACRKIEHDSTHKPAEFKVDYRSHWNHEDTPISPSQINKMSPCQYFVENVLSYSRAVLLQPGWWTVAPFRPPTNMEYLKSWHEKVNISIIICGMKLFIHSPML